MTTALTIKLPDVTSEITLSATWLEHRDALVADAQQIKGIENQATYDAAADLLRKVTKSSNELEKIRKDLDKPFRDAASLIKETADKARQPLETVKASLQRVMADFAREQQRKADEERRKLEEAQRREAEEAAARHQELVEAGIVEDDAPINVPEVKPAVPITEAPKASGIRMIERIAYTITDDDKVASMFRTTDERKINAWRDMNADRIKKAIKDNGDKPVEFSPGIEFRIEMKPSTTGR